MDFFLPFKIQAYPFRISYRNKIALIGSCFSEEIGNKMSMLKFNILQNPNGILYDPLSIAAALKFYINNDILVEKNLFEQHGLWHSWQHHSSFSGTDKDAVLNKINDSKKAAHDFIADTKTLIITFGTAFHYQLKEAQQNVANCHKAPAVLFQKKLLSTEEIISATVEAICDLQQFNPEIKIVFTVSPVKHIRDGIVENNLSKARLIHSVHSIIDQLKNAFYFPSYEIVTDILRDYRFYKSDLVHPNEQATQFVFDNFCRSFLSPDSFQLMENINAIISAANHAPFFKESDAHQKFITTQLQKIELLEKTFPFINFSTERDFFNASKNRRI